MSYLIRSVSYSKVTLTIYFKPHVSALQNPYDQSLELLDQSPDQLLDQLSDKSNVPTNLLYF